MNEESIKYRRLAIMVLAKALDDICPKFLEDPPEERAQKIKERIEFFSQSEPEIDQEWEELEKEAKQELKLFTQEREALIKKIKLTDNSIRIHKKVHQFEQQKYKRIIELHNKISSNILSVKEAMHGLDENSKKYNNLKEKLAYLENFLDSKIRKTEIRYNTIIKNTINSENSAKIVSRVDQSKEIWKKKYNELRDKFRIKESIHDNRRMELDQIRLAITGFENEREHIAHWCLMAGVPLKQCYTEAINRAKMVKRNTKKLEKILQEITEGV